MIAPHTLLIAPLLAVLPLLAHGQGSSSPGYGAHGDPRASALLRSNGSPTTGGILWVPPVGGPFEITGPYRAPPHRYGAGHRGIDFAAAPGTALIAPATGTVSFSGRVVDRDVLSIRVDERTVYTLEPVRSTLPVGAAVTSGAVIGEAASGGHCLAECVHLGVRVDDEYVNPLRYLLPRPVLLPAGEPDERNRGRAYRSGSSPNRSASCSAAPTCASRLRCHARGCAWR
ncbi:M23 family metallopeptidase [Leucobacter triazinivorans]|uniref:M23 family metallopeptidase n=1 Tax=Leucobacter triazinivorans TaxID=1784719 RepID=A0A4P6KCB2_9MICO|nr:peptidoglycan DD-metalloendopeptidase family protein [Leucobacter triazinivorans]QBE47743.1 M23 family metallopeptidase [Leucobacter triazinivorans]